MCCNKYIHLTPCVYRPIFSLLSYSAGIHPVFFIKEVEVVIKKGCVHLDNVLEPWELQVCNAVAVARMLNATLVLPRFSFNSVWRDSRYLAVDFLTVRTRCI